MKAIFSRLFYRMADYIFYSKRYPFIPPEIKDPDYISSLSELVQEPFGIINGHTISIWFYREGKGVNSKIVEVMEAGHSNSAICSKVTSLIHETLIELNSFKIELYTAGSLWLKRTSENTDDQKKLRYLEKQLRDIENETGLVKVFRNQLSDLRSFRSYFNNNKKNCNTKELISDCKIKNISDEPHIFDYMNYYQKNSDKTITFTINRSIYENKVFRELSQLHDASFRSFRIRDIIDRSETYAKWLLRDIHELIKLMNQKKEMPKKMWQANIIPYSGVRDYYIGEASEGKGNLDPIFRKIMVLYSEWYNLYNQKRKSSLDIEKELLKAVKHWNKNVFEIEHTLDYGLTNHENRLNDTAPYFIMEDLRWLIRMIRIIIFEHEKEEAAILKIQDIFKPILDNHYLPIPKNLHNQLDSAFNAKTIDYLFEKLQIIIENWFNNSKGFPDNLKSNIGPIFEELNQTKKDIKSRNERMSFSRIVNEKILVDAMIRGWPSFFLNTKELRDIYDLWVNQVRKKVWREIRFQLLIKKIKIYPLLEENISFQITFLNKKYIKVIPFFGINSNFYTVLYHKKIGTSHYIQPWSYKEFEIIDTNNNINKVDELMTKFWELIKIKNPSETINIFLEALKIHPVRVCSTFFSRFWENLGNIDDSKIEEALLLQKGISLTEKIETYNEGLLSFQLYIEKFPNELADPYIFLSLGEARYKLHVAQKNHDDSIEEYNNFLEKVDFAANRNDITRAIAVNAPQTQRQLNNILKDITRNHPELLINQQLTKIKNNLSKMNSFEILNSSDEYMPDLKISSGKSQRVDDLIIFHSFVKEFDKKIKKEIKMLKHKIEKSRKILDDSYEKLWNNVTDNKYYKIALEIDTDYSENIIKHKAIFNSSKFQLEYKPYLDLIVADSKIRIAMHLNFWLSELKEKGKNELKEFSMAKAFKEHIKIIEKEIIGISKKEKEKIDKIVKLKIERIVENPKNEDSLTRIDLLSETEGLVYSFINAAVRIYETCHAMLPSFAPAYMKSMELKCSLFPYYKETLNQISKQKTIPLEIGFSNIDFHIEKDTNVEGRLVPEQILIEDEERIVAYSDDKRILSSIRFRCDDKNTIETIRSQIQQPKFCNNLFPLSSSLGNRILKTNVDMPLETQKVLTVLSMSIEYIKFILAYMGVRMTPHVKNSTLQDRDSKELLRYFRDNTIYTKEQQNKTKEYLNKLDNSAFIDNIVIEMDRAISNIRKKDGYMF